MTERLRYTGSHAVTFRTSNVGRVEPEAEFDVPDEMLRRFIGRADIEHAGECPKPPCVCGDEPQAEPERRKRRTPRPQQDEGADGGTDATGTGDPDLTA